MLTRYIRRITVGMGGGAGEEQGKAGEWEWGFKSSNHYTFLGICGNQLKILNTGTKLILRQRKHVKEKLEIRTKSSN